MTEEDNTFRLQDFYHYSNENLMICNSSDEPLPLEEKGGPVAQHLCSNKPSWCFWFARGTNWIDWCRDAGFVPNHYVHRYQLDALKDGARLLVIKNKKDAIAFEAAYATKMYDIFTVIDWTRVCADYDAVYLPLLSCWERTGMSLLWYTLDVDSLVVFQRSSMQIKLIESREEGFID